MLEANEIAEDIQDALPVDSVRQLSDNLMLEANEMAKDVEENLGSMIDDVAYASGPGDASVAGMDYASGPGDASVAGMDYASGPGDASVAGMDYASGPGDASVAGMDYASKPATNPIKEKISETNPFFNEKGEFDLNAINLPGMKKYGADLKSQTQSINKKDENQSDAETARLKRQADSKKTAEESNTTKSDSKADAKSSNIQGKQATLDDVVKQLSSLNKNMQNLIDQNQKLLGDQIRATKANSNNSFVGVY